MATLNMDRGGDIAKNLQSLYSYMFSQLIEANMNKKTEPVVIVIDLLKELRAAWTQINSKKKNDAKRQNTPGKGMMQNNQENAEKRISVRG
jgi:flagellar protein FliS